MGLRAGVRGRGSGAAVVFRGWREDTKRGSVGVVCPVVKDEGGADC